MVFFLPQTGIYVKNWEVLDIGLDLEYLASVETTSFYVDKNMARGLYKVRDKFSHKGTYGHVLMVGGSYGKIGSMVLSSEAALNSGAGLVTSFLPSCGYTIMQTAMPEVMVITDANEKKITQVEYDFTPSSVGIGMGMGTAAETVRAFSEFLTKISFPIVIDADALNILASHPELLRSVPENSVLTPHPKELERLVGEWKNDFEKLKKVREFSKRYKVIVVIKGAHTITIFQKERFINSTGNPGMATAGSGDALTGIIAGLMAQKYSPLEAAVFGVYLHGLAGDLSVGKNGWEALTATEIIDFIGDAYLYLFQSENETIQDEDH